MRGGLESPLSYPAELSPPAVTTPIVREGTEALPYGRLVRRRAFAATLFGAEEEVEAALAELHRRNVGARHASPLLPLEDYARRREAVITRRMRAKESRFLARSRSHLRQSAEE